MLPSKVCSKCKKLKLASEFTPRPERSCGLSPGCKACKAAYRSARYKRLRVEDPVALWLRNAKNWAKDRARKQGLPFELTSLDMEVALAAYNRKCVYCERPFNFQRTIQTRSDSPTLDQILPKHGYVPNNIVVCCHRCNMIKNEASPTELRKLAETVTKLVADRKLVE
jgi:5-methylcytosine-specific restriction endonuclease McrA